MKFDGKYAYDITNKLSYPRMVGSEGDARARNDIETEMKSIGLETSRQDFVASTFPMGMLARFVLLAIAAPMFAGTLALWAHYEPVALLFGVLTVVAALKAVSVVNGFQRFYKYGDQVPTQNVIGTLNRAGAKARVVLMAHFDSKSQPFPIEFRIGAYLLGGLGLLIGVVWLIVQSAGVIVGAFEPAGSTLLVIATITTLVCGSLVFNTVENKSVGSLDNAAGVGTILALAKAWVASPPNGLDLTVVATSAEEWGLQGADRWIEKHASELDPAKTIFLNYDGPGSKSGDIIVTTKFGLPRREISGPELKADFEAACHELGINNARDVYIPFGANTDMMPVSTRGFRVLNIGSLTTGVHTTRDNMSIIDAGELQKAGDIGVKVVQRFESRMKDK